MLPLIRISSYIKLWFFSEQIYTYYYCLRLLHSTVHVNSGRRLTLQRLCMYVSHSSHIHSLSVCVDGGGYFSGCRSPERRAFGSGSGNSAIVNHFWVRLDRFTRTQSPLSSPEMMCVHVRSRHSLPQYRLSTALLQCDSSATALPSDTVMGDYTAVIAPAPFPRFSCFHRSFLTHTLIGCQIRNISPQLHISICVHSHDG